MPPRARVAKATAPKVETPAEASAVPADVDPFALTQTGLAGLGEPLAGDKLNDDERAELEGYRAMFADSDLGSGFDAKSAALTIGETLPAAEGEFCRIHHPNGWPGVESGATCEHGTFWRWGEPSALERSGQTVMDPTTDDWSDQDV